MGKSTKTKRDQTQAPAPAKGKTRKQYTPDPQVIDHNQVTAPVTRGRQKATKAQANGHAPAKAQKTPRPRTAKSKRLRLFELLADHPDGLDNVQIRAALDTQSIAAMCRDECVAETPRMKYIIPEEDKRGKRFVLTKAGHRALEKGTVDSAAPPAGRWPEGTA